MFSDLTLRVKSLWSLENQSFISLKNTILSCKHSNCSFVVDTSSFELHLDGFPPLRFTSPEQRDTHRWKVCLI